MWIKTGMNKTIFGTYLFATNKLVYILLLLTRTMVFMLAKETSAWKNGLGLISSREFSIFFFSTRHRMTLQPIQPPTGFSLDTNRMWSWSFTFCKTHVHFIPLGYYEFSGTTSWRYKFIKRYDLRMHLPFTHHFPCQGRTEKFSSCPSLA
jgi:hypothetical protein